MNTSKLNKAVVAAMAAVTGVWFAGPAAQAQSVIGTWENLITPPPPDPDPLPPNFHRPIGSDGTEGWGDWQNRGIYTSDTYGATNGTKSLKLVTADDGGGRWMQSLYIPMHVAGHIGGFLTSGTLAIDVSWRISDWVGGNWSQVENLYLNSAGTGFTGMGRATTDTSQTNPDFHGSWDTSFGDDTRTLTWDMTALVDGDLSNGEMTAVPSANGGGYLELIFATNYDDAFDPSTAAFYFDNVRLLPRVVDSEWKGGAPDPDGDPGNGNAAENFWYASMNWVNGVPGQADSTALFATNNGALVGAQTINTNSLVTLGAMTFNNSAGYTLGGTGSIAMSVSSGQANIAVIAGNHVVNLPVALTSDTNVSVAPGSALSIKRFSGAGLNVQQGTVRIIPDGTSTGTSKMQALTLAGGASPTASLDLTDNAFVIDYTGASPLATVRAQIASAYAGGAWSGQGITSSLANSSTHGVGYAEASSLFNTFPATFRGESVDDTSLLMAYARYGDANLDGLVNLADFNRLAANFGSVSADWSQGDFTYDGLVNLADFNRLAANFGLQATGTDAPTAEDWSNLAAAVPEPSMLGLVGVAVLAGVSRPRRRRDV